MDYLPYFLKTYNIDLQPTNSKCVDVELATSILYPGAHIATSNPYEHYHHGIVANMNTPDLTIIHFWGPDKNNSRIQTTTLPIFLAGSAENLGKKTRHLYLIDYDNDNLEKQQNTVQVAQDMLDKADDVVYNLATANCESFAYFCRTGTWRSEQIERLKELLIQNADKICEELQNANSENRKQIATVLETIPPDVLSEFQQDRYHQLCEDQS